MDAQVLASALQLTLLDTAPYTIGAYEQGKHDFVRGVYNPPSNETPDFDTYIRSWNDAWAKANGRNLLR